MAGKVREGKDPSLDRRKTRKNPPIREFCDECIVRRSLAHNKPSTTKGVSEQYQRKVSKSRLATLTHASRTQVNRVLDPNDGNMTVETLQTCRHDRETTSAWPIFALRSGETVGAGDG